QQRQAVIAEIYVVAIEEEGWRAEAAAAHQLLGIGAELLLDRHLGDASEEALGLDAEPLAEFGQHRVLRNIAVIAPICPEGRAGEGHELALRLEPEAAAHRLVH